MSTSNIRKDSVYLNKLHKIDHQHQEEHEKEIHHLDKKRVTSENVSPNTKKDSFNEDDSLIEQTQPSNKVSKIDHSESPYLVFKISVAHLSHFFRIIHVPSSINLHYFFNIVMEALDWNNETHRIHPHYYIDSKGKFYGNTKSILQMPSYENGENLTHRHFPHIEEEHDFSLNDVFSEESNREMQLFYTFGKEWKVDIDLQSDKQAKLMADERITSKGNENSLVYCVAGQGGEIDESNRKVEGEFNIEQVNQRLKSF